MKIDMKVNFIILGVQKCGTTALADLLSRHQEICFCSEKEPSFFNTKDLTEKNLTDYHNLFFPSEKTKVFGEGSTMYFAMSEFQGVYPKIHEYNPNMKFILLFRNPFERIISHYVHQKIRGEVSYEFTKEILNKSEYLNNSRYFSQLRPYLNLFPKENFLFLFFEDFKKNPDSVLSEVYKFLGISEIDVPKDSLNTNQSEGIHFEGKKLRAIKQRLPMHLLRKIAPKNLISILKNLFYNVSEKPTLDSETKETLRYLLQDDIEALEKLTNRNLSHWLN
jgi:hypothetical protein